MSNFWIYNWRRRPGWLGLFVLLFAALFYLGYQHIVTVNSVKIPPIQEPLPLKIPRQYDPNDTLLDLKIERDRERSREVERVEQLLEKVGLSDEVRKQAETELWRLTQSSSKEHELENLLQAKGFTNCLVTIGQRMVTVVVPGKLQPDQAGVIGQMAVDITAFNPEQIQVVER